MSLPANNTDPPPGTAAITDVQIRGIHRGRLRAIATVVLSGSFVVRGIKVIQGPDRLFVAMPSRKLRDGTFEDIAHPSTQAYRDYVETVVLAVYQEMLPPAVKSPRKD